VLATDLIRFRFNGIEPSPENMKTGAYPLFTPFSLVWKGRLSGLANDFVSYIFSPEGKRILETNGTLPAEDFKPDGLPEKD